MGIYIPHQNVIFYILFFINFHSVIKEYERSIVFWWD